MEVDLGLWALVEVIWVNIRFGTRSSPHYPSQMEASSQPWILRRPSLRGTKTTSRIPWAYEINQHKDYPLWLSAVHTNTTPSSKHVHPELHL